MKLYLCYDSKDSTYIITDGSNLRTLWDQDITNVLLDNLVFDSEKYCSENFPVTKILAGIHKVNIILEFDSDCYPTPKSHPELFI